MEKAIDRRAARTRRSLHKALIALIVRKNYEAITIHAINEIGRVLSDMVSHELRAYSGQNAVSRDLALEFVVSTFLTVLTWLLMRKQKLTPSQADQMFRQLVINGMGSSLAASS